MDTRAANRAIARLQKLADQRRNIELEIRGLVDLLRAPDMDGHCVASWADIGAVLGCTRQSAWERYGS